MVRSRQKYGPPCGNRRGREKSGKGSNSDGAIAHAGRSASGSPLVTDWPLLLPPCVKTQMACFGWSKAPVSYSLGSAQSPGHARIAPWVGWVGRWGGERVGGAGAVDLPRGVEGQ